MLEPEYRNICRICLLEENDMVSIFVPTKTIFNEISLCKKIMLCCQVEVALDDQLPNQLCSKCTFDINVAYELRTLAQNSDIELRKYLQIIKKSDIEEPNVSPELPKNVVSVSEPSLSSDESQSVPTKKRRKSVRKKTVSPVADDNKQKEYVCPECGKSFLFKCGLREHMVAHTGAKPYLCNICGKSYGHQTTLSNHMKIHNSNKDFKCDLCSQSFHRRSHLILHKRTHTGEKPYACSFCNRKFAQSAYLKEHVRVHSGEKPFVCETCGHGFARKSCLIMHRRTHTGELPYPCPECNQSFSQRSQRKRHVLRNHKGSPAIQENGDLILREHDQLRAMFAKFKEQEISVVSMDTYSSQPEPNYQSLIVGMPS